MLVLLDGSPLAKRALPVAARVARACRGVLVLVKKDVADAIIDMAEFVEGTGGYEDEGCDLIARATHGRGGFERWMLGSITERVLTGTKLPVLVVRPHAHAIMTSALTVQGERSS